MSDSAPVDVVLIGGGIMSATLGTFLQRVHPEWKIEIFERLGAVAEESSNPWNNAGTGHSALCELNYMPDPADPSKALQINEQFQQSRQFWAKLVEEGVLPEPTAFINPIAHMTFVNQQDHVEYLRARYETLKKQPLFSEIEYSEDAAKIAEWAPLLIEKRAKDEVFAATRSDAGTDVNFGALSNALFDHLTANGAQLHLNSEVTGLKKRADGTWKVTVKRLVGSTKRTLNARFVFVGAGGWALKLLQRSGIKEAKGYGVFPVSGFFLRTDNPEVVAKHAAKVYAQASAGAPPMSVPHLDKRLVDGKGSLLFGPYAGLVPKFLKQGSVFDLPGAIRPANIIPYLAVAKDNIPLLRYLAGELAASRKTQFRALQKFLPSADPKDWYMIVAGQRAQVIKKDAQKGGVLQFGTEVVAASDGSIVGLLGASPGASTAVPIMLDVMQRCFPTEWASWEPQIRELIPTLGTSLNENPALATSTMAATSAVLKLRR
ncbi:malate dehydrogenase (quinone) [Gryllotalpicola sp.]|uniref:malate dehydrogenase (quinone) n=1 Tax=Gryllotalpicola sp. TaxID=1932787 RepID=UPI00260B65AD|nr:malate dehydrogenase (quinone) [Gryllotalpicola sp.]